MQLSLKRSTLMAAISALAIVPALFSAGSASAEPIRFNDSYLGAGVSVGTTNGGQGNDQAVTGANIQARIAVPKAPVSLRGSALLGNDNAAIVPTLTYDQRISNNANVYVGAGYSFVDTQGRATPLGNKNAPVVTVGAEAGLTKDIVVYGDAKLGVGAYKNSPADAFSVQLGAGYRF